MAGTIEGGRRAAVTNKLRYGEGFYGKIGAIGGRNGNTGGFASHKLCYCDIISMAHRKARCAGYKGGKVSRRGKNPDQSNESWDSATQTHGV